MLGWFRSKKRKKEKSEEPFEQEREPGFEPVGAGGAAAGSDTALTEEPSAGHEPAEKPVDIVATEESASEEPDPVRLKGAASAEDEEAEPEPPASESGPVSLFGRLQERLSKTRKSLVYRLDALFLGRKEIDQELYDELEEILITADMGVGTTQDLLDDVRREVRRRDLTDPGLLKDVLRRKIRGYLAGDDSNADLQLPREGPLVIMVVGVNGVGKTTSIGKIAAKFVRSGKSVLLVAADTFRAAAVEQLKIWARRCGADIVARDQGADPSSVVFDAIESGRTRNVDVIIVDTAGRLHTQVNLMEELKKIKRVIGKKMENAPHEVMLVLDATTGQNGISQARLFNDAVGVTGITLTKLDGTAKGGIVINICRELGIPVRFIGIGEQVDDLRDFDSSEFVDALFKNDDSGVGVSQ